MADLRQAAEALHFTAHTSLDRALDALADDPGYPGVADRATTLKSILTKKLIYIVSDEDAVAGDDLIVTMVNANDAIRRLSNSSDWPGVFDEILATVGTLPGDPTSIPDTLPGLLRRPLGA